MSSKTITFTCQQCGSAFNRFLSEVRKGTPRYCSRSCWRSARANNVSLVCPQCGGAFSVWKSRVADAAKHGYTTYCSSSCRNAANGVRQTKPRRDLVCESCGTIFHVKPVHENTKRFCSNACWRSTIHTWATVSGAYGFREDLGHICRSTWEANVCRILRALGMGYAYEPRSFELGGTSYTPDLLVSGTWIEVKGWMTTEASGKIAAFRRLYPDEPLMLLDRSVYKSMEREWKTRLPEWE